MRKVIVATIVLIISLACSFTVNTSKEPTEFVQLVYVYEQNSSGGTDIAVLAEKRNNYGASFAFLDKEPNVNFILQLQSSSPFEGLEVFVTDNQGDNQVVGISDSMGHAKLSTPYQAGKLYVNGGWTCEEVAKWYGLTKDNVVLDGGALWQCKR